MLYKQLISQQKEMSANRDVNHVPTDIILYTKLQTITDGRDYFMYGTGTLNISLE